ncbi:class I SAM-dependent methyltransferase [Paenibacillus spongiae]|uniref:Class I SAM-dependent methyltransferase n=1 Tax=Paenibacillus spongiae TaxID=2909671 RepID=A0ABY5S5U7_9BACL|nr:class I SAM-dependent methyltransferase [Paenibacillus spongiae]UVI29039.1 class I SAM-dependent methyltransferase [Paenibacillus spongiae]
MGEWNELNDESQTRWDANAGYWDDYMGAQSNQFHRELIRPHTEQLLKPAEGQTILDIACGNGNFSRRLAELGANVVAFDYSPNMIERAIARSAEYAGRIEYRVADASSTAQLHELGIERFDSAVANMALMDIADIAPLVQSLLTLLKPDGIFVFSITHPCFQNARHEEAA